MRTLGCSLNTDSISSNIVTKEDLNFCMKTSSTSLLMTWPFAASKRYFAQLVRASVRKPLKLGDTTTRDAPTKLAASTIVSVFPEPEVSKQVKRVGFSSSLRPPWRLLNRSCKKAIAGVGTTGRILSLSWGRSFLIKGILLPLLCFGLLL